MLWEWKRIRNFAVEGKKKRIEDNNMKGFGLYGSFLRIAAWIAMALGSIISCFGENTVSYTVYDSVVAPGLPTFVETEYGNMKGDRVDIGFKLISPDPFIVYKVEWVNVGEVKTPLEPFYLDANVKAPAGKSIEWQIDLDFPFTTKYTLEDELKIYTDKGTIINITTEAGKREKEIRDLKKSHSELVSETERLIHTLWLLGAVSIILIAGIVTWVIINVRRKVERRQLEIENLSEMIEERQVSNLELRDKVNALYKSRLDTLNMLCEGYFNNNDSDKTKQLFYKDVENTILSLRDSKSLERLEGIVNEYLDDTIARVRFQIPELTINDLKFLTYIYAGFSPRAVCVFMDIKMKTFYNRRNLLKERILASDAPDKEYFVSLLSV